MIQRIEAARRPLRIRDTADVARRCDFRHRTEREIVGEVADTIAATKVPTREKTEQTLSLRRSPRRSVRERKGLFGKTSAMPSSHVYRSGLRGSTRHHVSPKQRWAGHPSRTARHGTSWHGRDRQSAPPNAP